MSRSLWIAAALASLTQAATPAAAGWQRQGTVTTPRGSFRSSAAGGCAGGTCARSGTTTGPRGESVTHSGATSCAGGTCTRNGTLTGPNGGSVTTSGSLTRTP